MHSGFYLNQAQLKPVLINKQNPTAIPINNNLAKMSFNGYIPVKNSEIAATDRENLCRPLNQTSCLFRPGLAKSLNKIINAFPGLNPRGNAPLKPVKFYVYGCAEGQETYSIIMYLIKRYGSLEEAKKRVEIHSIDILSPALTIAKSRKLKLTYSDFHGLISYNRYSYKKILESISTNKDIDSAISIHIKDEVFEYANFKEGRILKDFSQKGKFDEKEPVVVFFRNSLPYIKPEKARQLIDDLYSKLPEGSFFCIGDYDHCSDGKKQLRKVKNTFKTVGINWNLRPHLFKKSCKSFLSFIRKILT